MQCKSFKTKTGMISGLLTEMASLGSFWLTGAGSSELSAPVTRQPGWMTMKK